MTKICKDCGSTEGMHPVTMPEGWECKKFKAQSEYPKGHEICECGHDLEHHDYREEPCHFFKCKCKKFNQVGLKEPISVPQKHNRIGCGKEMYKCGLYVGICGGAIASDGELCPECTQNQSPLVSSVKLGSIQEGTFNLSEKIDKFGKIWDTDVKIFIEKLKESIYRERLRRTSNWLDTNKTLQEIDNLAGDELSMTNDKINAREHGEVGNN